MEMRWRNMGSWLIQNPERKTNAERERERERRREKESVLCVVAAVSRYSFSDSASAARSQEEEEEEEELRIHPNLLINSPYLTLIKKPFQNSARTRFRG
ncbi:hypothetical protein RIF29_28398 [Crotalaria pallida]|uniref:Uncharacterized protein n=1 Tax=Crotalaria pallida TaxID=3830 RepID=A0AAN9ECR1_CROPI